MNQYFEPGDLVLLINSVYNPEIIGHVGTVCHGEAEFTGTDKFGRYISGIYVVVDLPGDVNRYGTTLWYLKPVHLVKLSSGKVSDKETALAVNAEKPVIPYNRVI